MPTVAYTSMKRRRIHINKEECRKDSKVPPVREMRDVFTEVRVNIKSEDECVAIALRKDFVRWRVGNMTLCDVIARRKQEGRSDWYV